MLSVASWGGRRVSHRRFQWGDMGNLCPEEQSQGPRGDKLPSPLIRAALCPSMSGVHGPQLGVGCGGSQADPGGALLAHSSWPNRPPEGSPGWPARCCVWASGKLEAWLAGGPSPGWGTDPGRTSWHQVTGNRMAKGLGSPEA